MLTDPLSDALSLVDARCALTGTLIAGGNWSRKFQRADAVKFLAVVEGGCWMAAEDGALPPARFEEGDVLITNGAPGLVLASSEDLLADPISAPLERDPQGHLRAGDGADFMMIGGLLEVDEQRRVFLHESLPTRIHIESRKGASGKLRWLLTELADETQHRRPGSTTAITHLAKLLFVEALRLYIEVTKTDRPGWLTALDDKRIAAALRGIHAEPARAWNLEELARLSGMSRTSFAVRFREMVGVPPLTYVINWRMRLAERELSETNKSVAEIAWSVGYSSESAFSNAFSRATSQSPGRFRKAAMQAYPQRRSKVERRAVEAE